MIPEAVAQDPIAAAVIARFGAAVTGGHNELGELTLIVDAANIVEICRFLKDDQKFIRLSSVTAVDWHPREPRFEIVYHLQSVAPNRWLRVKAEVGGETPEIDSVFSVWRGSDWYEREVFDLFGVAFRGHPNLQRLMMPEGWQGHPLRKDYPVHGFKYSYVDQQ
jgi:NADH-quinone oxidoreductase subunit C